MGLYPIYGTWGSIWTKAKQDAATREMTVKYGSRWIGKMVTDCSGLLRWALKQLNEDIVHHARYQYTDYCTSKGLLINGKRDDGKPILPGTAVFLQGTQTKIHHVGVYIGGDTVIEAKGTIYGVVTSRLSHWDHWGELSMVDYTNAAELEFDVPDPGTETEEDAQAGTIIRAVVSNPNTWLNVRSKPSSESTGLFKVMKGSIVEILDGGEPDWWKIRYEGKTGWALAKYLTPIEEQPEEPVIVATDDDAGMEPVFELGTTVSAIESQLNVMTEALNKLRSLIENAVYETTNEKK